MVVPQSGQRALIAGFPFFIVTLSGLATSFLARHFTQYIVAIIYLTSLLQEIEFPSRFNFKFKVKARVCFLCFFILKILKTRAKEKRFFLKQNTNLFQS